jgi:hypothetical protein
MVREILRELTHIRVDDRQLQRRAGAGMPLD